MSPLAAEETCKAEAASEAGHGVMNVAIPAGFLERQVRGGFMVALDAMAAWASKQVQAHGSLERFARLQPNPREIRGRGPAYLVDVPGGGKGIVRRLRHGGLLAGITGDRFLPEAVPRPVNELLLSFYLRSCGVETPEVLAACVFPGLCHYTGEILRAFHPDGTDLAEFLFESEAPEWQRERAVALAASLATRLAQAGICHSDYHARNLLVRYEDSELHVLVLDLEKARRGTFASMRMARYMRRRLLRSLKKRQERSRQKLSAHVWSRLSETSPCG